MTTKTTIQFIVCAIFISLLAACSSDQSPTKGKAKNPDVVYKLPVGWFDVLGHGTWKELKNSKNANILLFDAHRYFIIRQKNFVFSHGKIKINHRRGIIQLFNKNGRGQIRFSEWTDQGFKVTGHLPLVLGNLSFASQYQKSEDELGPPIPNSLLRAAKYGDLRAVKGFLGAGSKLEKADKNAMTPLALAVQHHHTRAALYLLKKGANIKSRSSNSKSILEYAMAGGHVQLVEALLSKGADIKYKHGKYPSLFLRSFEHNSLAVIKSFIKHGADVYELDQYGYSALYRAMSTFSLTENRIIERFSFTHYLIDQGGYKAHTKDRHGRTALFYAANLGLKKTVSYFLDKGVDPNQKDNAGQTVFDYISDSTKKKLVWKILIKHKR